MTDETTQLLNAIKSLDLTIRELTEAVKASAHRPTPAPSYTPDKSSPTKFKFGGEIPQPSQIIPNAGEVLIHFGKNTGTPLGSLIESSLRWYASEPEPRLNGKGEPFPPRMEDVNMRNAARTRYHTTKGTLVGAEPVATPSAPSATTSQGNADEDVPF